MTSREFPEVESLAGAPSVLASPFAAMHGLPSPLAGPYNGVAPAGSLAGLGGFTLGAGALGVRVPGSPQPSSVLLISNLNEEVSAPITAFFITPLTRPFGLSLGHFLSSTQDSISIRFLREARRSPKILSF